MLSSKILLVLAITLILILTSCGSDRKGPGDPGSNDLDLTGVWFSSTQTGEHTLYLDAQGNFLDAAAIFVTYPDFDPWRLDPIVGASGDISMGTYAVEGGRIRFTYLDNRRSETFNLVTEGLSTSSREDDLLQIGGRAHLWSEPIPGPLPACPTTACFRLRVTDAAGGYDLYPVSTLDSRVELDYFGTTPITVRLCSVGGRYFEFRLADYHWIRLGTPIPFDGGAALGVDCTLEVREGLFEYDPGRSTGSVTFSEFRQVGSIVYVSGTIQTTRLYEVWEEDLPITVSGTFTGVPAEIVS